MWLYALGYPAAHHHRWHAPGSIEMSIFTETNYTALRYYINIHLNRSAITEGQTYGGFGVFILQYIETCTRLAVYSVCLYSESCVYNIITHGRHGQRDLLLINIFAF